MFPASPGTVPEPPFRIPGPHPTPAARVAQSPSSLPADGGEVLAADGLWVGMRGTAVHVNSSAGMHKCP